MYRHPEFSKVRTIAETSLLFLYRMLKGRIGPISEADPFSLTWNFSLYLDWSPLRAEP